jgi:hypothetical protein
VLVLAIKTGVSEGADRACGICSNKGPAALDASNAAQQHTASVPSSSNNI